MIELSNNKGVQEIYPSHEDFNISVELLTDLAAHLENIDKFWDERIPNSANKSWEINVGMFKFLIRVGIKERRDFKSRLAQN